VTNALLIFAAGLIIGAAVAWIAARARSAAQEREAETRLSNAFRALSADALQSNNQSFLELAKTTLEKYQEGARHDLSEKARTVEDFVKPIKESLEKVNSQIEKIEQKRSEDYGSLSKHVDGLRLEATLLNSETRNLTTALRTPVVRGRWGEIQLKRVVEMAGMLSHVDFREQQTVDGDEGRLRPDLVVKLPGGKQIVVDSKVPLESFLKAVEAPTPDEARVFLQDHARQVRVHVTKLHQRSYGEQFESTPEFVVMFLPGENFFSAALEHDPTLIEVGASLNVIIATPTTLIALLRAVAYGWKQEKIAESAEEISELGRELYNSLRIMTEHFANVGTNLNRAVGSYNEMVGSLETRVLTKARRFSEHGVKASQQIPDTTPVEKSARTLQSPDLSLFPLHERTPEERPGLRRL